MSEVSHHLVLRHRELRLRVDAPAADLAWLVEFLGPAFPQEVAEPVLRVVLVRDDASHTRTLERGALGEASLPVYALEGEWRRLPRWRDPEAPTVFDAELAAFVRVDAPAREVRVLAREGDLGPRIALMRVVRELAMRHVQRGGARILHASACESAGRALVITGPRASGKSSLLAYLLHEPGVRYVANDRVVCCQEGQELHAGDLPTVVAQRPDAVKRIPRLQRVPWPRGWLHRMTLDEVERAFRDGGEPWPADLSYNLSPAQLAHQLEVERSAGAPAGAVVFPSVGDPGPALERLPPAEVSALLASETFPSPSEEHLLCALDPPAARSSSDLESALARLPGFRCRLDPLAYASRALARCLLALIAAPEKTGVLAAP